MAVNYNNPGSGANGNPDQPWIDALAKKPASAGSAAANAVLAAANKSAGAAVGNAVTTAANSKITSGTPGSTGGTTGSTGSSAPNYYNDLAAMFNDENEKARQQMLNAIQLQLDATKRAYQQQMASVGDEYDNLIDQNEVRKARAQRIMRENHANLGITGTGLGRQERLGINVGYDNQTSNLGKAKQQAIDEIQNLIIQAEAQAENSRANANNSYNNALLQWKLANL